MLIFIFQYFQSLYCSRWRYWWRNYFNCIAYWWIFETSWAVHHWGFASQDCHRRFWRSQKDCIGNTWIYESQLYRRKQAGYFDKNFVYFLAYQSSSHYCKEFDRYLRRCLFGHQTPRGSRWDWFAHGGNHGNATQVKMFSLVDFISAFIISSKNHSTYTDFNTDSKLYIPSTIHIWKKVLIKAIWADKKWAGFLQIFLYIK